jgi:hypothetical protein
VKELMSLLEAAGGVQREELAYMLLEVETKVLAKVLAQVQLSIPSEVLGQALMPAQA